MHDVLLVTCVLSGVYKSCVKLVWLKMVYLIRIEILMMKHSERRMGFRYLNKTIQDLQPVNQGTYN